MTAPAVTARLLDWHEQAAIAHRSPVRNGCCFSHGVRLRKFPHGKYGSRFSRNSVSAFRTVRKRNNQPLAYPFRRLRELTNQRSPLRIVTTRSHGLAMRNARRLTPVKPAIAHRTRPEQNRNSVGTIGFNHISPLDGLRCREGKAEALPGRNRFPDPSRLYDPGRVCLQFGIPPSALGNEIPDNRLLQCETRQRRDQFRDRRLPRPMIIDQWPEWFKMNSRRAQQTQ